MMNLSLDKTIFSPRWYLENVLNIVDKNFNLTKMKLNYEQRKMMEHIEFCLANNLMIRIIVLKARQIGSTTFFSGIGYWLSSMNVNTNYGIVAHNEDSASSIFEKCKVYYNNTEKELRPSVTQFSNDGIKFNKKDGKGINSGIKFATVSEGVFRGQTFRMLHKSEVAFWEVDNQTVNNSLSPTVPDIPGTIIVEESTANGYNSFKDRWDNAVSGKSGYTPFFFGWQDHEEYFEKNVPSDIKWNDRELYLKEKFNLSDGQLYWRRNKLEFEFSGNEDAFGQEYPMTPEEAFIASGGSVFRSDTVKKGYENCSKFIDRKEIRSVIIFEKLEIWEYPNIFEKVEYQKKAEWNDETKTYEMIDTDLVIERNKFMTPYTVAVDTSGYGEDFNIFAVVDNITGNLVAKLKVKNLDEMQIAQISVEIAKFYNNAFIAPETNFSHEVADKIVNTLKYKNVYYVERVGKENTFIGGNSLEYGWKTTKSTKPTIISNLRNILNEDVMCIKDIDFWREAEYYLIIDNIKYITNAAAGHHDDYVMAYAIARYIIKSFQAIKTYIKVTNKIDDEKKYEGWYNDPLTNARKKNKKAFAVRKGIYNNNA